MYSLGGPFISDRHEPPIDQVLDAGVKYIPVEFAGEAILTIGRALLFARQGAALVANCSPFGCMPGALTTSCLQEVQAQTGVPMVGMFYDGDLDINDRISSYLANVRDAGARREFYRYLTRQDIEAWA